LCWLSTSYDLLSNVQGEEKRDRQIITRSLVQLFQNCIILWIADHLFYALDG